MSMTTCAQGKESDMVEAATPSAGIKHLLTMIYMEITGRSLCQGLERTRILRSRTWAPLSLQMQCHLMSSPKTQWPLCIDAG